MKTPKRLIELIQGKMDEGMSKRAIALKMGINTNGLDLYLDGKTEPRQGSLEKFAKYFGVTTDWILGRADSEVTSQNDFVLIPRYSVRVSAGSGAFNDHEDVVDYLSFRREWVEGTLGMKRDDLALVTVSGDSMAPTLQNGDVVMVDMRNQGRFHSDAIYLINGGEGLKVKRIQKKMDGTLVVKSDNKQYDPEVVGNPEMIRIVGRVVWAGKRM